MQRREWLQWVLGTGIAALLPGCRFFPESSSDWSKDFQGIWLFGMSSSSQKPEMSRLSCVDFTSGILSHLDLPMPRAHQVVNRACKSEKVWVVGNECDSICEVRTGKLELERKVNLGEDGYLTSGHALFLKRDGKECFVTSEYKLAKPESGTVCIRSADDFSVIRRFSSKGSYPHVISFRETQNELVVQNLGHRAGLEQYSPTAELVVFDWNSLTVKRVLRPGREHGEPTADEFQRVSNYQLDSKHQLYPERRVVVVEHAGGQVISLWNPDDREMLVKIPLGKIAPLHSFYKNTSDVLLVANQGGGLYLVPRNGVGKIVLPEWLKGFHTDMHVGPIERTFSASEHCH